MLPSLSGLSVLSLQCPPCGVTFDEFDDARGSEPAAVQNRSDWNPAAWNGEASPICAICLDLLHRRARGDRNASKEVEALFENPDCSHVFHRECIQEHILSNRGDSSRRCPTCKRPIDQDVLDSIFTPGTVQEVTENDNEEEEQEEGEEGEEGEEQEEPEEPAAYYDEYGMGNSGFGVSFGARRFPRVCDG